MVGVTGVLLGVAEVKLPLRRLPQEMRKRIAEISHIAVVSGDEGEEAGGEEMEERKRSIGVVDRFYALQEVTIRVESNLCEVKNNSQDVVLKHRISDVIIAMAAASHPNRVIYITRCDNYGRAAVVLQMLSPQYTSQLLALFPEAVAQSQHIAQPTNGLPAHLTVPVGRDGKSSWGKGMGKKISSMLTSLTKKSPTREDARTIDARTIDARTIDDRSIDAKSIDSPVVSVAEDSDTSESESESEVDDEDSVGEGRFYEGIGLDKAAGERLYQGDDSDSVDSVTTDASQVEAIENAIKFFLETDGVFLRDLQSLEWERERLASEDTPQFIRENLTLLFAQVKALASLHTDLHREFELCGSSSRCIAEAIVGRSQDYERYVYFMENIPTVDRILQNHRDYFRTNAPLLAEKLRKPRMRLHYYVLTLETLQKRSASREERRALQAAADVLKIPLKKADSKLILGAVTDSPFDLGNFGNVIRHSDVILRRGPDLPRRSYHLLLLKPLILVTESRGWTYRYVTSFRTDQVSLGKQERGVLFYLDVRNGPRGTQLTYVFKVKNINLQQMWINDLREVLKDKSQPSTPRNSLIEPDSELRSSGRRSRFRRGASVDKVDNHKMLNRGSGEDEGEEARLQRSASSGSQMARRGAIKKQNSSASATGRSRPLVRQHSGYTSDGETGGGGGGGVWRGGGGVTVTFLPPLTVWSVFTQLEALFRNVPGTTAPQDSLSHHTMDPSAHHTLYHTHLLTVLDHEEKYVDALWEQLGSFLDDDMARPPSCLVVHLRNLYKFHQDTFRVALQVAVAADSCEALARCFLVNQDTLRDLYASYLADRARLDTDMKDMALRNPYVYPVLHLELYLKALLRMALSPYPEDAGLCQDAARVLQSAIADANAILLTETVDGAPFDLNECGVARLEGNVKVKFPGQILKQDLYAVLFESMILLLEPHPPRYQYVDSLRMDQMGLGPKTTPYNLALEVRATAVKTLTYVLKTPRKDECLRWEKEITCILTQQVEQLKEKHKRRLGDERRKMKELDIKEDLHVVKLRHKVLETSL